MNRPDVDRTDCHLDVEMLQCKEITRDEPPAECWLEVIGNVYDNKELLEED